MSVRSTERWLATLVGWLAACVVVAIALSHAAPSTVGRQAAAESLMYRLVNDARADHGLPPLQAADDVADVAWEWSVEMATTRDFDHNPRYTDQICCWELLTENVAFSDPPRFWRPGDPVERMTMELHEALLESPGHRANILSPDVNEVGIGIHVDRDGSLWITQNFRRRHTG